MNQRINAASALAPGVSHARAMERIAAGVADPVLGPIAIDEVQLCPQHSGRVHEGLVDDLLATYPDTRFRLHATPRVAGTHQHRIVEAVDAFDDDGAQIAATAALSRRMSAPGYSIHAGQRRLGTLAKAFDNIRRMEDLFQCRVGIEGLYPSLGSDNRWLMATWAEHEQLLTAGIDYALDLSHLNILARRERDQRPDLVDALVASDRCLEIHVSDNEARLDSHRPLTAGKPVWWMKHLAAANPAATIFYEGILLDPRQRRNAIAH